MLRRDARLRREYLHRKGLEGKERLIYEKKRKVKEALEAGKPIPTELRAEGREIQHAASMDDARTETLKTHVDDEYARLGVQDPRILITTSRDPSSRLTSFVKELRLVFPNSQRLNRGNAVVKELVDAARGNDFSDLVIIHEHRGEPDGMIVCHLPYGPTAYFGLSNVVLRHDLSSKLGTMSEAAPHLIFDNFSTQLGERISTVLKALFPVPKPDSRRVMTFANRDDTISFRHHVYTKGSGGEKAEVDLGEVGPRFEAKIYQLKLGTVEQGEAENEWVLRPYQNTAKKRKAM